MRVARLRLGRRASEYLPAGDNMTSGSARPTLRCSFRRVICVKWKLLPLLLLTLPLVATLMARTSSGPPRGSLVVVGGDPQMQIGVDRFVALAGGAEANFVYIPTAA